MKLLTLSPKRTSVFVAKNRLQELLTSDRVQCSQDCITQLREDLYYTISKYMEIKPDKFNVNLSRSDIHITITGE